jgi:Tol biopolymer transport system component
VERTSRSTAWISLALMGTLAACGGRPLRDQTSPTADVGDPVTTTHERPPEQPAPPAAVPRDASVEASVDAPVNCALQLPPEIRARTIAFDSDRDGFRQLYTVKGDGSGLTHLLADASGDKEPSFSPDGTKVAFTSDRAGASQIFILDVAARSVRKLTARPEGADEPSFSHDGAHVTYHSDASVYIIDLGGSGERIVATGLGSFNAFFWPHFSLDDKQLVFDRNNEIDASIIGTSPASTTRMIVQNTTTTIKSPAVSPDGVDVAYQAQCFTDTVKPSIWTTPFSSNTEVCMGRRVTPATDTFFSQRPAWATTNYLAYERVDPSTNVGSIAVVSRDLGQAPCVLVTGTGDNRNPSWSP